MIDEDAALRAERAAVLDLLRDLDPADWDEPSARSGWRVRDVAAALSLRGHLGLLSVPRSLLGARGDVRRLFEAHVRTLADAPAPQLVARYARLAGTTDIFPTTTNADAAIDTFVRHHDIALALGRAVLSDPGRLRWMADGLPQASPLVGSAKRVQGLRLRATDIDWHYGTGPEVVGPAAALLVASVGRRALDEQLEGDGVHQLVAA